MANRKRKEPQVILYKSWLAMFLALDHDQNGQILEAITHHVICGHDIEVSETIRPLVESVLSEIDVNMTQYLDRCETNKRIADQREHERATNVTRTCNERDTIVSPNAHVINTNTNTNTSTNITLSNDKGGVGDSGESQPAPKKEKPISKIVPPKIEWVKAYAESIGHPEIDCDYFFDHYVANEWTQGKGKKIRDWQAAFRNWVKRESEFNPKKTKDDEFMETIMNFGGDGIG